MAVKLTLSIDPRVVEAAKRYASDAGTSVSRLVEAYLAAIASPTCSGVEPPMLSRFRGSMEGGTIEDYGEHLVEKYGA